MVHPRGLAVVAMVTACTASSPGNPPQTEASAPSPASALPAGSASARGSPSEGSTSAGTEDGWAGAVRLGRWKEAAAGIDALSGAERARPEVRYARARVAAALGDPRTALRSLDDLERELPALRAEILSHRAEAQLEVGPYREAAEYFAARGDAASLARAAAAFEKAGDLRKARVAAGRAVRAAAARAKRSEGAKPLEAEARAVRARIAERQGARALAAADLRWIATVAPTAPAAEGVDDRLAKLGSAAPKLSKRERLSRALAFARAGRPDDTERELARLESAPGSAPSSSEVLFARAWSLYAARTDYAKAADLFEGAMKGAKSPARETFYSARARSRANDDERAVELYDRLIRRFPKSRYADDARYLAARLRFIGGKWKDAAKRYAAYVARHRKRGRYLAGARYERAVALLAGGEHEKAARSFDALAARAGSPRAEARLRQLEAVALAQSGKKARAVEQFSRIVRDRPLSFAALASAARLQQLGVDAPPVIGPPMEQRALPELRVTLPAKVQLLARIGLDGEAEEELRRHERRLRKAFAPRGDEALCAAYGKLGSAARRYRVGQRAVRWEALTRAPSSRNRWAWDCIYPKPYEEAVRGAALEWKLRPELIYAVMRQESAFAPGAVSPARAVGLMQLIPPTARSAAREVGIDFEPALLTRPAFNIRLGAYYLSRVLAMFGGRIELAAAAYNAGPAAVSRWLQSGEDLPLDVWVARIPYRETRSYVARVVGNVARYAYLREGEAGVPRLVLELPRGRRAPESAY